MRSKCQPHRHAWLPLLLLFAVAAFLSGCADLGHQLRFAAEDIIDMQAEPSGIYTLRLGRWTADVPDDTRLEVDARHDYEVQLVTGDTRLDLGKLQQQLPDTPAKTMFLDTGSSRFILGWVDDKVEGTRRTVLVSRAVGNDEQRPVNGATLVAAISALNGSRLFFIPILYWKDLTRWETLDELGVYTYESRKTEHATGYRWAAQKKFVPPLDTKPLYHKIELSAP